MSCPICNKASATNFQPFCSKRCADIDLNRWFVGSYAIPTAAVEDEDGDFSEENTPPPTE